MNEKFQDDWPKKVMIHDAAVMFEGRVKIAPEKMKALFKKIEERHQAAKKEGKTSFELRQCGCVFL